MKKTFTFKNPVKPKRLEAKALEQKQYAQRIVPDKTKYSRKRKEKDYELRYDDEPTK